MGGGGGGPRLPAISAIYFGSGLRVRKLESAADCTTQIKQDGALAGSEGVTAARMQRTRGGEEARGRAGSLRAGREERREGGRGGEGRGGRDGRKGGEGREGGGGRGGDGGREGG